MAENNDEHLAVIDADDVEWTMRAFTVGDRHVPEHQVFQLQMALAVLLANDVCFLNSHWFEDGWPEEAKATISVNVNCNDVFAWACSDAERLPYKEIENLYRMWLKDPHWGPAVWCIIQRKQMPQKPVAEAIKKAGVWDLTALMLDDNWQDAEVHAMFAALRGTVAVEAE